ncbi:MAG: DUF4097 family beta strand repeat-containing protein [Silanimonas sp.]
MTTMKTTTMLRPLLLAAACVLAFPTMAADRCEHSRNESPTLDLAGVTRVVVDIGADELVVTAGAPSLAITHCASTADRLAASTMTVQRRGDTLVIDASTASFSNFNWFADNDYLYREITLALPADLPITLDMGSGDAALSGLSDITIDLGSGDVSLRQVGAVTADIGSGDLVVDGATRVSVDVGSGDAVLKRVQGDVRASVGAGDVEMVDVGPLAELSVGSGGIAADGVRGDARIDSGGSGDITLTGVRGRVLVGGIGSGDVRLRDVGGDVQVANQDTLEDIDARGVRGRVVVGG